MAAIHGNPSGGWRWNSLPSIASIDILDTVANDAVVRVVEILCRNASPLHIQSGAFAKRALAVSLPAAAHCQCHFLASRWRHMARLDDADEASEHGSEPREYGSACRTPTIGGKCWFVLPLAGLMAASRDCFGGLRWTATACRRCGYEIADCTCLGGFAEPVIGFDVQRTLSVLAAREAQERSADKR